jgi:hypothetical protein
MYTRNLDFSAGGIKMCSRCGAFNPVLRTTCCLCSEAFEVESDGDSFDLMEADVMDDELFVTTPVLEEHPITHGGVSDSIYELATTDVWLLTRSIVSGCINRLHLHG